MTFDAITMQRCSDAAKCRLARVQVASEPTLLGCLLGTVGSSKFCAFKNWLGSKRTRPTNRK